MDELMEKAIKIHNKTDKELDQDRESLTWYLMNLGADPEKILEFSAIVVESTIRDFKKELGN